MFIGENMNQKGFTFIEIIAVVVLMALLSVAIVPAIIKQVNKEKDTVNEVTLNLIYEATDSYVKPKYHTYETTPGNVYCLSLSTLVDSGVLDKNLKDSKTGKAISLTRQIQISVNGYQEFEYQLLDNGVNCVEKHD